MRRGVIRLAVVAGALLWGGLARADAPPDEAPTPSSEPAESAEPAEPADDAFDFGDLDDDAFDFGDVEEAAPVDVASSPFSLTGFFRSEEGFWVERLGSEPLAKARQSLDLLGTWKGGPWRAALAVHGEYDAAYLIDRARFDRATLEAYEWLVDIRRAHLGVELGPVDVTVGYQVLNWGEGDAISLADLSNPRDMREPGLADLEDLRLPALMTRVGWFSGAHRVELAWIHEAFFGYRTPPLGPFSPLPALLTGASGFDVAALLEGRELSFGHRQGRFAWDTQQWLGRWSWRGEGLDLALFGGLALDHQGVVLWPEPSALVAPEIRVDLDHRRFGFAGFAGARPVGDWLLKWEAVFLFDKPWNTLSTGAGGLPEVGVETSASFGGMLGVQYGGVENTQIALEMAQTLPFRTELPYIFAPDTPQIALRINHLALRETLTILAALTSFGWKGELGWVARAEVGWRIQDGIELGLGYIHYEPSSRPGPIAGLDRHDRLSLKFRWDFQIL